jgi:3-phosphoshikimate 1-carboxyvinyltransferase
MIEIQPLETVSATVRVAGSKSHTHRLLVAAGLSGGDCSVLNPLRSEDTGLTLNALKQFGVKVREGDGAIHLTGTGGRLRAGGEIFLGNSGTSMRLLTAVAALADGPTVLDGTPRMRERPVGELLEALAELGVNARSVHDNQCPPVALDGGAPAGGPVRIRCGVSSQYLSGLLLMAPCLRDGLDIRVTEGPVSRPYIDMTVAIMEGFGVRVERDGYSRFAVPGDQPYRPGVYRVAPDVSNASYFWAAAAITGGTVTVRDTAADTLQGDIRLLDRFQAMGCQVERTDAGIAVTGGPLRAVDVDMGDIPDMVPTLAVVAAFAEGTTVIRNVAHLRAKECDRLDAVATELGKMGVQAETGPDSLRVTGGPAHGADIHTYDDHRIAMSFAVAGLRVPGVRILDEHCVGKSFPKFWEVFRELYPA